MCFEASCCRQSEADVLRQALTAAQTEIARLTAALRDYACEEMAAHNTIARLRCDAQGFHDAAITATQERDALKAEVDRLKDKLQTADMFCDAQLTDIGRYRSERHTLQGALRDCIASRDALAQDAARLRDVLDCGTNALRDSICASGNDVKTNLRWVQKMRRDSGIDEPDARCFTMADGSCEGVGCMHDAALSTTTEAAGDVR
jgi:hypothetical protein